MRVTPVRRAGPWLIGLALLIPLPWLAINEYQHYLLNVIGINIILAVGLNIVKGFAGQVTVGHIALAAIGAYSSAVLSVKFGLPFWLALPGAMLITGLAGDHRRHSGVPPRGRLSGARHAGPGGIGAYLHLRAPTVSVPPSATGTFRRPISATSPSAPTRSYYYLVMPLALAGTYFSFSHPALGHRPRLQGAARGPARGRRERRQRAQIQADRIPDQRALRRLRRQPAAHMAPGFIHPNNYTIMEMVTLLLMVVFGGIGHIWGGVIGAIVVTIIDDLTRDYYQYRWSCSASIIVLTVSYMPKGIGGLIDRYIASAGASSRAA